MLVDFGQGGWCVILFFHCTLIVQLLLIRYNWANTPFLQPFLISKAASLLFSGKSVTSIDLLSLYHNCVHCYFLEILVKQAACKTSSLMKKSLLRNRWGFSFPSQAFKGFYYKLMFLLFTIVWPFQSFLCAGNFLKLLVWFRCPLTSLNVWVFVFSSKGTEHETVRNIIDRKVVTRLQRSPVFMTF